MYIIFGGDKGPFSALQDSFTRHKERARARTKGRVCKRGNAQKRVRARTRTHQRICMDMHPYKTQRRNVRTHVSVRVMCVSCVCVCTRVLSLQCNFPLEYGRGSAHEIENARGRARTCAHSHISVVRMRFLSLILEVRSLPRISSFLHAFPLPYSREEIHGRKRARARAHTHT